MTKFGYKVNEETGKVEKSVLETYPDVTIIDRGVANKRPTELIIKQQLKAEQGAAEAPIVKIEEEWFNEQQTVENLNDEKKVIEDQLSGVAEVIDEETGVVTQEAVEQVTDEDEVKKLNDRLEAIVGSYTTYFDDDGHQQTVDVDGELKIALDARADLETDNEWLKAYRGEATDAVRPEPAAEAKVSNTDVKRLIAHERDLTVRNSEDSIADVAKMVSLAFSVIATLWELTPDDAKNNVPDGRRGLIDYAVAKFESIDTRADRQLVTEGTVLVDKLYDREVAIANIIDKVKN